MSEGERVTIPFLDTPVQLTPTFPKEILERVQLEKYRLDYLVRFGEVPFEDVRRGADPPDFLVTRHGSRHALDCAALTLPQKRTAEAIFTKLVQKVVEDDSAALQHLEGTHIIISFGYGVDLPPKVTDSLALQEVVKTLEETRFDRGRYARINAEIAEHGLPEQMTPEFKDSLGIVEKDKFSFQVSVVEGWQPRDELSAQLGFDWTLNLPLMIRETAVNAEIQRLVSKHDNGKIDQLLIVIGGPNYNGIVFPAEQALSSWLNDAEPVSARHISEVTAHDWFTSQLFDIPVEKA